MNGLLVRPMRSVVREECTPRATAGSLKVPGSTTIDGLLV
jgi:hypothetical protein